MSKPTGANIGTVYLVGAGPGDAGLITLRGVECLRRADVVLYDYLVNPEILTHVRADAELICLGRHGGSRLWSQEEINRKVVDLAEAGRTVVRLKGGDPAVFARVAEEAEILISHQIPYQIVPGITAALAASSYAGIPITHRDHASAVAFVTGQRRAELAEDDLDYEALARFPGTLVFYMGVTTAAVWSQRLLQAGKSPETPAAIVRRCSFANQQTIRCTLAELPERMSQPTKIRPPALIVIGSVASLPESWSWFERQPLFGSSVLVTRPAEQSGGLARLLSDLGAEVLNQPAIQISEPEDWAAVDAELNRLEDYDWLVFSSSNGVQYLMERLLSQGGDLRRLGKAKLAVIGPGTANALGRYHLRADLLPEQYRAESLADALAENADGKRFLLLRASRGREVLAERLVEAGGFVRQVVVYQSTDVTAPEPEVASRLAEGRIDWVTVTSSAIAKSLSAMFDDGLRHARLASISPVTSETLRDLGLEPAVEAVEYTMPGVVQAIRNAAE